RRPRFYPAAPRRGTGARPHSSTSPVIVQPGARQAICWGAMTRTSQLSVELESAALRAVRRSYDDINGTHFRWALRAPSFELVDSRSRLGRWVGDLRLIELSRPLLLEHGWGVLVEVLKHEMVHQYVEEVLGVVDESSHGPVFRKVCTDHGFDFR